MAEFQEAVVEKGMDTFRLVESEQQEAVFSRGRRGFKPEAVS